VSTLLRDARSTRRTGSNHVPGRWMRPGFPWCQGRARGATIDAPRALRRVAGSCRRFTE
jgi:hypothetical protein